MNQFCSRNVIDSWEIIIFMNVWFIERIKILHSKLPLRYQRHKTTNSQKLPCQQQKSKLHTTTHNFHTTHFHYKSNTTKRFVSSSSKKWLPRIFFIDPNSRWYCILPWTLSLLPIFAVDFCVPGLCPLAARGWNLSKMWNIHQVCLVGLYKMAASDFLYWPKLMMILHLPWTLSLLPIFAVDFCVPGLRPLAARGWNLSKMWNMHQVCLVVLYKMAASDFLYWPKLMMILHLPWTLSLLPIFAVDFCVPGLRPLAARGWNLSKMWNMHQVRLVVLYKMAASDFLYWPKLTMILHLPWTLSLLPIFAVDFCVPGLRPLAARGWNLLKMRVSTCLWFVICSVVGVLVGFLQDVALF
jgi:hypothetical protein